MQESFSQEASGSMTYPGPWTLNRVLFKTPLLWWRMGLRPLLWRRMIILATWGRKTRKPRYTMLSYTLHAGKVYLISGWGDKSDWYRNLQADPHATVQLGGPPFATLAYRVEDLEEFAIVMQIMLRGGGDSHFQPWLKSLDIDYDLQDLIAKRDSVYLVALDPSKNAGPPALRADLSWVSVVLLAGLLVASWVGCRLLLAPH
jgi:deazaflavin-dependent oxidoreductase (nitroreductase family)